MGGERVCGGGSQGAWTDRGFSLLELLVTLAVAAVLAAIAVPSFSASLQRNRLAGAHNEFLSSIYLLRSEAAKRNRVVKMCRRLAGETPQCDTAAGGGWHGGWLIWVDEDGNGRIDGDEPVLHGREALNDAVRLTGNASVSDRIAFRPSGAMHGVSNGTFTICVAGSPRKRQLVISRAGRVRMQDIDSDGSC